MLKDLIRRLVRGAVKNEQRRAESVPGPRTVVDDKRAREAFDRAAEEFERGHPDAAERSLREAIALNPEFAEAHFRLGKIYEKRGAIDDAADCYELAVQFNPRSIQAYAALAALRKSQGCHSEAIEHYQRIVELSPEDAAAHTNLCLALHEAAAYEAARQHGERAVAIDPKLAEAHHNLGLVLRELGEPQLAVRHFQAAMELKPRAEVAAGLAHAYRDLGRLKEAVAAYDRALRLKPDLGDAVINRAYAFLLNAEYGSGWAEYEHRFVATGTLTRDFGLPRWAGENLEGKTILVFAEQGLGDEILFASCLPDILARAERVIVECSERLAPLFERSFPRATIRGGKKEDPNDWVARYAPVHFQVPIGSLPRWFRPTRSSFPLNSVYLQANPDSVDKWRSRLDARGRKLVGISWRGGGAKTRGTLRSVPLASLAPLLKHDAVFVSLQHGVDPRELDDVDGRVRTFAGVTDDPDQLAALIAALDLVVSVDNTTAQLAGALGSPVWVMLSASPEWRYGISDETMAWYSSARLFRQGIDRRWDPVVQSIADAFERWCGDAEIRGSAPR